MEKINENLKKIIHYGIMVIALLIIYTIFKNINLLKVSNYYLFGFIIGIAGTIVSLAFIFLMNKEDKEINERTVLIPFYVFYGAKIIETIFHLVAFKKETMVFNYEELFLILLIGGIIALSVLSVYKLPQLKTYLNIVYLAYFLILLLTIFTGNVSALIDLSVGLFFIYILNYYPAAMIISEDNEETIEVKDIQE